MQPKASVAARLALVLLAPMAGIGASTANGGWWNLAALHRFSGLTADQWNAVEQGRVQVGILDTGESREVAVVGAARLHATTACFVARYQNIETFEKSPNVLRIRKFTRPVNVRDFEGFSLEPRDIADLRDCVPGDCKVKLSAGMIESLRRTVDWSGLGYARQAQSIVRQELMNYIQEYQQRGNVALIVYRDKRDPVRLASEFQALLGAEPGVGELVPAFQSYLAQYPNESLPGVTGFFYWSTETFGLKPVATITQVDIYSQPGRAVIASKQLYASHYFDGSLGVTAALDDADHMYLVYLNRSRIDLLGGPLRHVRSAMMRGKLRDGMQRDMADVVRRLESSCR